jgi:beta-galactosidase
MEKNKLREITPPSKLYIGSAYYPEQWSRQHWQEDIRLMREAGFNVVRLGDFAWSALEPGEGHYQTSWLEDAITLFAQAGIESVLCTPSAAPPAWLVQKFPDILPIDENGRQVQFGNRCHYCVNSPEYHQAVKSLVGVMAENFAANPHVIGWQIDNEFNRTCYCPRCQGLFQEYLSKKFTTLKQLNDHWTTMYWSQVYNAWEQIPLPIGPHNPGLLLEFKHFITQSYKHFQRIQIDALRPHLHEGAWITHNFMEWHDGYDHYLMGEDLDQASWDWYVGMGHHNYKNSGAAHDLVRGYKRRNFWLMETQPGSVNWKPLNNSLDKGEARSMAWHAMGHGADAVLYWQWRSAFNGQEQYHGTLVDSTGQPRPFFSEAQQLASDFSKITHLLAGSQIKAEVALLNCYDSRWSIQWQPHHKDFSYIDHLLHYYRPIAAENISVDIISADEILSGYKLVIAPAMLILNDRRVANLRAFVKNGGHLVLTLRTGMKDEYNALLPERQPGALREISGVEVEEYYALLDPIELTGAGWVGQAQFWAERLNILDKENTQVLATYGKSNGWLDGQVAVVRHRYDRGMVTYLGAYLDESCQKAMLRNIIQEAGCKPVMSTPTGVEACRRVHPTHGDILMLVNHTRKEQQIPLPWSAYEHLQQRELTETISLEPYGVAILTHR